MKDKLKCIFNKRMLFSVEQDGNDDAVVNLLERIKQKRNELKAIEDK